jgi:predicted GNAT superfamily acetyltransferase
VRIEKLTHPAQLSDYAIAQQAVWPGADVSHVQQFAQELATNPKEISIYCAYVDDRPVGTGRVTFPVGSRFAELNGGGVVSNNRLRGIFSALLSRRIEEAKARGYTWVAVDAAPMSRPILLRKGFQHVCWTYPMFLGRNSR